MTKIEGLQDTIDALKQMGKLETKPIKSALRREGSKIIADARAKCPSETVKRAIKFITKNESKFPTTVLIGVDSKMPGTDTITVAPLATMLEYGSAPRWTKDGHYRGEVVAHPYIRPAFDMNVNGAAKNIENAVINTIEQQAKKNNLK